MGAMDRDWYHERRDGAGKLRRSPSGRVPQWALDDAVGVASDPHPWRAPATHSRRRRRAGLRGSRRRASRTRSSTTAIGVVLLVALLYATPSLFDRFVLPIALPYLPGANVPPRGVEAQDSPLGTPPLVPASGAYQLLPSPTESQEWVAVDPCRPVHYVVRPDNAPPGTEGLVQEAVAEVSAATGLHFVDDGLTTEGPSEERDLYQPELYGRTWAPLLITWTSPAEIPQLAGDIAGLGGSEYAYVPGEPLVYVGGQVQIDAPDATGMLAYPAGRDLVRATLMHELAHVVGLDHVDDPRELMYEANTGLVSFGPGDRAGLALLGSGPCAPGH